MKIKIFIVASLLFISSSILCSDNKNNCLIQLKNKVWKFCSDKSTKFKIFLMKKNIIWPLDKNLTLDNVIFYIKNGVDINMINSFDSEAFLHFMTRKKNVNGMQYLIKKGANIDITNGYGETPLHEACKSKFLLGMKLLLKQSANIEANTHIENLFGVCAKSTPLHYVCYYCFNNGIKLLLKKGANYNTRNNEGKTPFEVYLKRPYKDVNIVLLFLENGVNVSELGEKDQDLVNTFVQRKSDFKILSSIVKEFDRNICILQYFIKYKKYIDALQFIDDQGDDWLEDRIKHRKISKNKYKEILLGAMYQSLSDDKNCVENIKKIIDKGVPFDLKTTDDIYNFTYNLMITDIDPEIKLEIFDYAAKRNPKSLIKGLFQKHKCPSEFNTENFSSTAFEWLKNNDLELYNYLENNYFLNWSYGMNLGFKPLVSKNCLPVS